MLIDFTKQDEHVIEGMNGGKGKVSAKIFANSSGRVIVSRISWCFYRPSYSDDWE